MPDSAASSTGPATHPAAQAAARRYTLLAAVLILLILVEILTVLAVLASQRFSTERALRQYSHELLTNVVGETRENAAAYLRQAQNSVLLTTGLLEAGLLEAGDQAALERYFLEHLRLTPEIDSLYFGGPEGDFVFAKRGGRDPRQAYFSKLIRAALPEAERVTLVDRASNLAEDRRERDPDDRYDPRQRPWYQRAALSNREIWTDPYIFYTSQQPGLTVALSVRGPDGGLRGVVGADIELTALSAFLRTQKIGSESAAFLVHGNGDVLAHPDEKGLAQLEEGQRLRLKRLAEADPVAARAAARVGDLAALDRVRYERFSHGGNDYLGMFLPLLSRGEDPWIMGVYAREDELATRLREGQRESVFLGVAMSLLVVTATVLIALITLRPGRRTPS
jgi:hypothetical protein